MYASKRNARGFIALISVFVVSIVFLIAVVSLGQFGLAGRLLLLDVENKVRSEAYAEGCVQTARIIAVNDPAASRSNVLVRYSDIECAIVALEPDTPSAGESTITASSTVSGATTNFEVVIDPVTGDITSWVELPTL